MKKALAMVLAIMCVLALAGCGADPAEAVCSWMQNLKADDISETLAWNMSTTEDLRAELTQEQTAELVSLLNALTEDNFTDNSEFVGGTAEFGVTLKIDGKYYNINQSIDPRGDLEVGYGEKQWWIDNDALTDFVKSVTAVESFDTAA